MNARQIRYVSLSAAVLMSTAGFMTARKPLPLGCTAASLRGKYGYYRAGYVIGSPPSTFTPLGSIGFIDFNGAGSLTTTEVTNKDGTVASAGWIFDSPPTPPHSGLYFVGSDCTFRFTNPPASGPVNPTALPSIADGVIVGDELFMVSTGSNVVT